MERWLAVKDFPGYEISDLGNLRSWRPRTHTASMPTEPRTRKFSKNRKGFQAHRLVAEAFIPNPENKPQVAHIDGDPSNNQVSNLRWSTALENDADKLVHSTRGLGSRNSGSLLQERDVREIRVLLNQGIMHKDIAVLFSVKPSTISSIAQEVSWSWLV